MSNQNCLGQPPMWPLTLKHRRNPGVAEQRLKDWLGVLAILGCGDAHDTHPHSYPSSKLTPPSLPPLAVTEEGRNQDSWFIVLFCDVCPLFFFFLLVFYFFDELDRQLQKKSLITFNICFLPIAVRCWSLTLSMLQFHSVIIKYRSGQCILYNCY